MKSIKLFLSLVLICAISFGQSQSPYSYPTDAYVPGRVIFKLLPENRYALVEDKRLARTYFLTDIDLQKICDANGEYTVEALFPHHWGRAAGEVDLSLIGELIFSESVSVPALCWQLMATGLFEYVEPRLVYKTTAVPTTDLSEINRLVKTMFEPNDPLFEEQWHLEKIKALDAWNIEQGDTSVLIAIVDTGVDYYHPDLAANIAVNDADPINLIDDDGNGFIDDYYGWDFFKGDGKPQPGASHGTAVAGVASAVTDNGIGLAAPGFKSRIVCIKGSSNMAGDLNMTHGWEGVEYAISRGCKIINCSWSSSYISGFEQDIIHHATENDALIIGSAGNNNDEILMYPASAEHVISVAATNSSDIREPYSTFNDLVDISAPSDIWATRPVGTNSYTDGWTGTSFSAPLVAGAAAILAAHDPSLSALQIGERLRITADDIDMQNPSYIEKLGKGRLNMYRALVDPSVSAVRLLDALFTDGNDEVFTSGDTLRLSGTFINYLEEVTDLNVSLSTPNSNLIFLKNTLSIDFLGTMEESNNVMTPFTFIIGPDTPLDTEIRIRLQYEAAGYDDWQWISVSVNRTVLDLNNKIIGTTITSRGRIGFDDGSTGIGFQYFPNNKIFGVFGLMLGNSASRVSDAAFFYWDPANPFDSPFSNDFKIVDPVRLDDQLPSDIGIACSYNDSLTAPPSAIMGLSVHQYTYAWENDPFIIMEYEVTNNSGQDYNNFRVGLWSDFQIDDPDHNRVEQDSSLQMGYMYYLPEPGPYVGVQVLGESPFNLYAYNFDGEAGSVNLENSFSTFEKYTTLTESRPSAGFNHSDGDDVGMVVSSGPYHLEPGGAINIAFALHASDSLQSLRAGAEAASIRYEELFPTQVSTDPITVQSVDIYPNPSNHILHVQLPEEITTPTMISLFNLQGRLMGRQVFNPGQPISIKKLPKGLYFLELSDGEQVYIGKFMKQ